MSKLSKEELLIRGAIAMLPEEDQANIEKVYQQIKDLVESNGDHGVIAISLVGIQMQNED